MGGGRVEPLELRPDGRPDGGDPLWRGMRGVKGVEYEFDAPPFVLAVKLGVPVVVTDQRTATDAVDSPDAEMAARGVVSEITRTLVGISGAEPLVVASMI